MSKVKIQGNASGTGVVTLTAPNTNTDRTITLPDSTGSILDSTSTLDATKLSGALPAIDGSALTGLASANQAQVQTHLTTSSSQSVSAFTRTNITGLNATITPSTTSKRIKVTVRWAGEYSSINVDAVFGLKRGTTDIGNPAASGSRMLGIAPIAMGYGGADAGDTADSVSYSYIDSPSTTSATTYFATHWRRIAGTLYNQRTVINNDANNIELLTSSITLEEID